MAVWLLGLWLGLLIASWAAATMNFRTADRLAAEAHGGDDERARLRHMAAEINRWIFRWWPRTEVLLAVALILALGRTLPAALVAAAAAVALAQVVWLGPAVTELGRTADFMPRPLPAEIGRRFGQLHGAYAALDLAKAVALVTASVVCVWRAAPTRVL